MSRRAAEYGRVYMSGYTNPRKREAAIAAARPLAACTSSPTGPDRREQPGGPGGWAPFLVVCTCLVARGRQVPPPPPPAWYPVREAPACELEESGAGGGGDAEQVGSQARQARVGGEWTVDQAATVDRL